MKRIKWLSMLFCMLLMTVAAGQAETADLPDDGLYTIGVQSSSRMFNITRCVLHVWDGQMTAVITLSGTGYGYAYPGTAEEANAAPMDTWIPYVEDWDGAYTYAVPISALDEETAVAAYSKRYEKWYDRTLVFHSSTLTPYEEIAPDGVYSGIISSNEPSLDGQECLLTAKSGMMTVDMPDGSATGIASLDQRLPMEGTCWIMVRTDSLKEHIVRAADGVYMAEVTTDSSLLRFTECTLKVENGQMTAVLTAKNKNFDYIYVGTAAEAVQDESGWIPALPNADGAYTYVLEISSLDNEIRIATYSARKKMWYDRTMFIDSASLNTKGGEQP
ncbi:MAG: hypothetical protein Q4C54_05630 [Clostridia bacterium]|nr:hypothetical protein [Clostridia bacterium]